MTKQYTNLNDFPAWELDAYADGEEMPHVAAFLEQNPAIKEEWLKHQRFDTQRYAVFHRFDCPDVDTIRSYYWNELPPTESQFVQNHLQACPRCAAELASLQAFMLEASQAAEAKQTPSIHSQTLLERVQELANQMRIVIATLVIPVTPQLATVTLRSDKIPTLDRESQASLLFTADDTDISLLLQKEGNGMLQLSGQIFTTEPIVDSVCKLIPANPLSTAVESPVDEVGTFVMSQLRSGDYQLMVICPNRTIIVPNLTIR